MVARLYFQMSLYSVLFHGSKAVLPNVLIQCIVSWQQGCTSKCPDTVYCFMAARMYFQMSLYSVLFHGSKDVLPNVLIQCIVSW